MSSRISFVSLIRCHNINAFIQPFRLDAAGYTHVGTEVWNTEVNGAQEYKVCTGSEDPTCSDSVLPGAWNALDHFVYMGVPKLNC